MPAFVAAGACGKVAFERGESLAWWAAEHGEPAFIRDDALSDPRTKYVPELEEERFQSLLAVPIQRSGQVLGVLVVQNRTQKEYSDEDVEVLLATAMVVAEHLVSGAVAGAGTALEIGKSLSAVIEGEPISAGIALGHIVLHEPRIVVTQLLAEDTAVELGRLDAAIATLRASLDEMFDHEHLAGAGEHREVPCAALFCFIGAEPATAWLGRCVELDAQCRNACSEFCVLRRRHTSPCHYPSQTWSSLMR